MKHTAYIALGSNLKSPIQQLNVAILTLAEHVTITRQSKFYQTKALGGPKEQPDFVNAVLEIKTSKSASSLLYLLKATEKAQGRTPSKRWGPRVIDCDILLFDDIKMHQPDLTIPHPGLMLRNFVLAPLYEIAPNLKLPNAMTVQDYIHWQALEKTHHIAS